MIAVFADQHMREKAGTGAAALDGAARQRCLREGLAAVAGQARAHDLADDKPARDVFQFLRHILAEWAQGAAAGGAGIARGQNLGLSLEVIGQRSAAVLPFGGHFGLHRIAVRTGFFMLGLSRLRNLDVFLQVEGQLIEAFGFRPEPRLAMSRQLPLQVFHLQGQRLDLLAHQGDQPLQIIRIIRQGFQALQHGWNIPERWP
jgi:hypothetical protein